MKYSVFLHRNGKVDVRRGPRLAASDRVQNARCSVELYGDTRSEPSQEFVKVAETEHAAYFEEVLAWK